MRYAIFLFLVAIGFSHTIRAQDVVSGELDASNGATLNIVEIIPDTFPEVSLIFRAVDQVGHSFWDLRKEDTRIREDGIDCNIKCLYPVTFPKPLNISVVLDHSGSMGAPVWLERDSVLLERLFREPELFQSIIDTMNTPLQCAQDAMQKFIGSFDLEKDKVALTAFDHLINISEPLTTDTARLFKQVASLQPAGATAFYDAAIVGLDQLKDTNALNVLVALTDGLDNNSQADLNAVVALANERNIPVYTIGLGGAHKSALRRIAVETEGAVYFTDDPQQLNRIYAEIRKNIQAYYHLTYHSATLSSNAKKREVDLQIMFNDHDVRASMEYELPEEVVALLLDQEKQLAQDKERQLQKQRERRWAWAGGGTAVLMAVGLGLYFRSKRKPPEPVVRNVWPVPTGGELFIDLNAITGRVVFEDTSRSIRKSYRMNSGINRFDLGSLPAGSYTATITVAEEVILRRFIKV